MNLKHYVGTFLIVIVFHFSSLGHNEQEQLQLIDFSEKFNSPIEFFHVNENGLLYFVCEDTIYGFNGIDYIEYNKPKINQL